MRELLSKKEYRHLRLIETLFSTDDWLTLSHLASQLNCSLRILKDDLSELRAQYDQFPIHTSRKGIRLAFYPNNSIQSIYQKFLLESELFELLQLLLINDSISTDELAELLFISPSTLRRMIKKVNKYLMATYSLEIQPNPYHLGGDEKNIRYLYYQLYFESSSTFNWPFESINQQELHDFLNSFLKEVGISLTFSDFHLVKTVVAINLIRLSNGHEIHDVTYKMKETFPVTSTFSSWIEAEELFPFPLTYKKVEQLFFPFSTYVFLKDVDHLTSFIKHHSPMHDAHTYLSYWLRKLAEEWEVTLSNSDQLLVDIHNISAFLEKDIQTHVFLYDQKMHFAQCIQQTYPKFYKQLYDGLSLYRKKLGYFHNETVINYLVHTLFTHWTNLLPSLQQAKRKDTRILILNTISIQHANMVRDMITDHFNGHPEMNLLIETMEYVPKQYSYTYDMIICNSYIPSLAKSNYICIEHLPTEEDIRVITDTLQQAHLPKEDSA